MPRGKCSTHRYHYISFGWGMLWACPDCHSHLPTSRTDARNGNSLLDERYFGRIVSCFFCPEHLTMNKETMKFGDWILCLKCREKQLKEEKPMNIPSASNEEVKWEEPPVRDDVV